MKTFIRRNNETVLEKRRSSKPAIVTDVIYLVILAGAAVFLYLKIWFTEEDLDPVSTFGLMVTIGKGLVFFVIIGLVMYYVNDLVRLFTQRLILTDQRIIRYYSSVFPAYDEVEIKNIEYCYPENQHYISHMEDGDITIIDNESIKKTFRDIGDASIVCQHVTQCMIKKATTSE